MNSPRAGRPRADDPPHEGVAVTRRVVTAVAEAVAVIRSVDSSHEARLQALRELDLAHRIWFERGVLTGSAMEASRRPDEFRRAADRGDALVEALHAVERVVESPTSSARLRRERLRPMHRIDRAIDDVHAPLTARRCLVECVHAAVIDLGALYALTGRTPPWARDRNAPLSRGDLDPVTFVTKRFGAVFPEYRPRLDGKPALIGDAVNAWRAATETRGRDTTRWAAVQALVVGTDLAGREAPGRNALRQDFSVARKGVEARSAFFRALAPDVIRIATNTSPAIAFELIIHSHLASLAFDPSFPHELLGARGLRFRR